MRLANYAGRVRVELTDAGLLPPEAARLYAADVLRLADAAERINASRDCPAAQLGMDAATGEALAV